MTDANFQLRSLPCTARLGLTGFLLVLMGGLAASVAYIYNHYSNRDEQPKLTVTDIAGAYHGVTAPAPFIKALQRNHPEKMAAKEREALLAWLQGPKDAKGQFPAGGNPLLFEEYDNIDAGEFNPLDLIAKNCIECHSKKSAATGPDADKARAIPLDQWEDVKKVAFSKQLSPTPTRVLIISTHAHALALGTLGIALTGLLLLSRWPRGLVSVLILLMGLGLLADIGGWWIAQRSMAGVYILLIGGGVFNSCTGLTLVLLIADLWLPKRRG
ncbi:MAG: hypothetical protein IT436_02990 [Phycisphaerales bacterium]|nr:hypothetical protein [Phycisphaerales bacterium]